MITEWRQGVVTYLADLFEYDEVVAGPPEQDTVWRGESARLAVWAPGWDEISRDISLAAPTLTVRYSPALSKQPEPASPRDPSPIEDAMDALLAAFDRASQAPGFFTTNLSCRLTKLVPNYDPAIWRVEATLLAYTLGAAA